MGLVDELLADKGGEFMAALTDNAGFSAQEAQSFVPGVVDKSVETLSTGGLDLGNLLGGSGVSSLLSSLNVGDLASSAGIDAAKASNGLETLLPLLLSALGDKAGGADGLLSMLGGEGGAGALGAVTSLAGKLFNR